MQQKIQIIKTVNNYIIKTMNLQNVQFLNNEYTIGSEVTLINGNFQNTKLENYPRIQALSEDFEDIWIFVTTFGRPLQGEEVESKQQERTEYYRINSIVPLMTLFERRIAFCRERCILLHVLWAQLGYPSVIVTASNASGDKRHAVLLTKNKEGQHLIFDPENSIEDYGSDDNLFPQGYSFSEEEEQQPCQFKQNVQMTILVRPVNHTVPVTFSFAGHSATLS
ncbi:hypothetical protein [Akkermansia sp. AKK6]